MFRHDKYVKQLDYPFNAGYVVYVNYFFPVSPESGEESEEPKREFPKQFENNFNHFVDTCLTDTERAVVLKTFKEKKDIETISKELKLSTKELVAVRTRAFSKLKSEGRKKYILSDSLFVPNDNLGSEVRIGDILIESIVKTPDSTNGGGAFRLINVKKGNTNLFSVRMSTKTNVMTDEDLHDFYIELAKSADKVKIK